MYVNYNLDATSINIDCDFEVLSNIVSRQIGVHTGLNLIEIKYVLCNNCTTNLILNNMNVCVYIELKKNSKIISYLLFVTIREKIVNNIMRYTIQMIEGGTINNGKVIEANVSDIINILFYLKVDKDQNFKDKMTIVKVIKNYFLLNKFLSRIERSSADKYNFV